MFRVQEQVRVVDDAYDPDTARGCATQVAQAVGQGIPVRAVVAGELKDLRKGPVNALLGRQLAGVEAVDASSGGFQGRGPCSESGCACGAEDHEGFRAHRLGTAFQASVTA